MCTRCSFRKSGSQATHIYTHVVTPTGLCGWGYDIRDGRVSENFALPKWKHCKWKWTDGERG